MSERKYTDEEIIKALECCINADCLNCPRWSEEWYSGMCTDFLKSVLDLINRQKAEIAVVTTAVDNSTKEFLKLHDEYQDQKAEIEKLQEVNADLNESLRLAAEVNKDLQVELDAMRTAANSYKMHHENAKSEVDNLIYKLECLLCHATGGRLSKHTYDLSTMESVVTDYINETYNDGRAEAIKEFAEKLKQWQYESSDWSHGEHPYVVEVVDIDNLVAEMTEGE